MRLTYKQFHQQLLGARHIDRFRLGSVCIRRRRLSLARRARSQGRVLRWIGSNGVGAKAAARASWHRSRLVGAGPQLAGIYRARRLGPALMED